MKIWKTAATLVLLLGATVGPALSQDLIVVGNACVGPDCSVGMSFGFSTLILKENNLRIRFDDTSTTLSFPKRDWQISVNDTSNGGQERFSIEDITASTTPFTIEGGVASHALYVDSAGNIGLGTSTPLLPLHLVRGNTPTLRLEQDNSSGFTPQIWDVGGNEANFFVRDATAGSTLPLRIRTGAPSNSIHIAADGKVGLGTSAPGHSLHVRGDAGRAQIENSSAAAAKRTLLGLSNLGGVYIRWENRDSGTTWEAGVASNGFAIARIGSGVKDFFIKDNGDVEVPRGTMVHSSSRSVKRAIVPVDPADMVARVAELPLSMWEYDRGAAAEARHLGPMAEDFHEAFGLGGDPSQLAAADVSGVALAAIQGLILEAREKDARIADLNERLERLEGLIGKANH